MTAQRDPDMLELLGILANAVGLLAQAVDDMNPGAFVAPWAANERVNLVLHRLEQIKEAMGDGT